MPTTESDSNEEDEAVNWEDREYQTIDPSLDNYRSPMDIHAAIDRDDYFDDAEEVQRKTWAIPASLHQELRRYSIRTAGTPQHMGAMAIEAMLLELRPNSDSRKWMMHKRLRRAYRDEFEESNLSKDVWDSPPAGQDYSHVKSQNKTGFCFSAPTKIIRDFTSHLEGRDYGEALASALDRLLTLEKQLDMMHSTLTRIEEEEKARKEERAEQLRESGVDDLNDLRMNDYAAKIPYDPNNTNLKDEVKGTWKARRPVVLAMIRNQDVTDKSFVRTMSEAAGASSNPTTLNDWREIRKYIRESDSDEPLDLNPAAILVPMLDDAVPDQNVNSIEQFLRVTAAYNPCWTDDPGFLEMSQAIINTDSDNVSREEIWERFLDELESLAERIIKAQPVKRCGEWQYDKSRATLEEARDNLVVFLNVVEEYFDDAEDLSPAVAFKWKGIRGSIEDWMENEMNTVQSPVENSGGFR